MTTQDSTHRKSFISTSINNQNKIAQRLSFANERNEFEEEQLKGQLINIF